MTINETILARLPYAAPFLFVDKLDHIDTVSVSGTYYLQPDHAFYKGHFKNHPVTPGVILTEIMAQIGLVCLGIYLQQDVAEQSQTPFVLSSTEIDFLKPVYPGETVTVYSEKIYFRFGKLKCKVHMKNERDESVCEGIIAGILIKQAK